MTEANQEVIYLRGKERNKLVKKKHDWRFSENWKLDLLFYYSVVRAITFQIIQLLIYAVSE